VRDAICDNPWLHFTQIVACRGPAHRALPLLCGEGSHPNVGDICGAGLFLGVELVSNPATEASPTDPTLLPWLTDRMRERGLIVRNDDRNDSTTQLCPPVVIIREECDRVVAVLADGFQKVGRRLGSIGSVHAAR
jgi:adenosylmethionine-8-amino-7-oxononanoate aminotransferase